MFEFVSNFHEYFPNTIQAHSGLDGTQLNLVVRRIRRATVKTRSLYQSICFFGRPSTKRLANRIQDEKKVARRPCLA